MSTFTDLQIGRPYVGREPLAGVSTKPVEPSAGRPPGDRIKVDIARASTRGNIFNPDNQSWITVETLVAVSWRRGTQNNTLGKAGTISITLEDPGGEWDVLGGRLKIGDPVRVRLDSTQFGPNTPLAYGFITGVQTDFIWPSSVRLNITATDGLRLLSRRPLTADITATKCSDHVKAALAAVGWPTGRTEVETSVRSVGVSTKADGRATALTAVDRATLAEGFLANRWVNRAGVFVWKERRHLTKDTESRTATVQFDNRASVQDDEDVDRLRWTVINAGLDETEVFARAEVRNLSDDTSTAYQDAAAVAALGPVTRSYSAPFQAGNVSSRGNAPAHEAFYLVNTFKDNEPQLRRLRAVPVKDDEDFARLAALDLGYRVSVTLQQPWESTPRTLEGFVQELSWSARTGATGAELTCDLNLLPATKIDTYRTIPDW